MDNERDKDARARVTRFLIGTYARAPNVHNVHAYSLLSLSFSHSLERIVCSIRTIKSLTQAYSSSKLPFACHPCEVSLSFKKN